MSHAQQSIFLQSNHSLDVTLSAKANRDIISILERNNYVHNVLFVVEFVFFKLHVRHTHLVLNIELVCLLQNSG